MARLSRDDLARGVLTASAGNMAQGVAWCARQAGVPCTVIAPDTAPLTKIAAIERLGGRVMACALTAKAGKGRIVCVVSGGNLDLDRFAELVESVRGPQQHRVHEQ